MNKVVNFIVRYVAALFGSVYLLLIGFVRGPNRRLLYEIAHHFTGMNPDPNRPKPELPVISLRELFPVEPAIRLREAGVADGNVTPLELIVIDQLIVKHAPKRILEIGTFDGRTTLNMATNTADDARVFTLDLPKTQLSDAALPIEVGERTYVNKDLSGSRFIGTEYASKITQLYGDSGTFDFSPYANSIDFVFVDGSHSYDYVLNDSRVALRILRNGKGVMLWHDFDAWGGVTIALNELFKAGNEFKGLKHIAGTTLAYAHFT
ncbi:MAG: O-methyltransferase family 3 [Bacteroidetes bacterium]|nr:O-methyltransferase family 3 [Bacteroidota bacterium]